MALIYKRNSGTDLSLTTSWSDTSATGAAAAAIPTGADTVQFDTASLGGTYTNALTCLGVTFNNASVAPTFGGTTTIGTGGWTTAVTNNLTSIFTGTLAVGTNNQTWTMYKTTANTTTLSLSGALTGSATVTLQTAGANKAFFTSTSTTSTFTGTLILGNNTVYNMTNAAGTGTGAGIGNAATIQIDGTGSGISSSTGTSTFVSAIVANNSWSIGVGTILQAVNVTGTTTFGSGGAYTLTTAAAGTLTGAVDMSSNSHAITATAACTVAGALTLANTPYSNVLSGAAGALTISGATTCGSGSHTVRANGAGNVVISNTFNCGTGNQTFQTLSGAGTLTISNTLTMGAGSHTFNAGTAAITVSGTMTGTNGFTKSGANDLIVTNTGGSPSLSGTVTVSAGELFLGTSSQTGDVLTGITLFDITSTSANMIVRSNTAFTFDNPFQGSGNALFLCTNATGITIPDSTMVNMNSASAVIGSGVYANAAASHLNLNDFPTKLAWYLQGASPTGNIYYAKAAATTHTGTNSINTSLTVSGTVTAALYNNNASSANKLVFSGATSITGTGTVNFTVRGTNTGNNEISGVISNGTGTVNLVKNDAGTWILSGANTYTGTTTLTAGTLRCSNNTALGASTSAVTLTAGTLQISGGTTLNKSGATITNNGATIQSVDAGVASIDASAVSMGASFTILSTNQLSFQSSPITGGATTRTLTISGGFVYLYGTSTYVGPTTITSGIVVVQTLPDAGTSGGLGAPAAAQATITASGTSVTLWVNNTGSPGSTNRSINVTANSATLELDASDDFTYSSGGSITFAGTGSNTLRLSSFATGKTLTIDRTIADGSSPTLLYASSSGTVRLTGSLTYTGQTTVASGTLDFGAANRTLTGILYVGAPTNTTNVIIDNGFTVSANTTLVNNGKVSAVLTGAKTLTVNSAATTSEPAILQPDATTTGSNTFTGNATIGGVVDLITPNAVNVATATYGRVLGNSNTVTVSTGGAIRTKTLSYSNQRGRARYNNLTFSSGSALYIGGAA